MEIGLNAYKKGFKGVSKDLKGKQSLSDYQSKRIKREKNKQTLELREAILRM